VTTPACGYDARVHFKLRGIRQGIRFNFAAVNTILAISPPVLLIAVCAAVPGERVVVLGAVKGVTAYGRHGDRAMGRWGE